MAPLSAARFQECAGDPRKFLEEMQLREPGTSEWCSLGALFAIGCLNRGLDLALVEEVVVGLAAINEPRYERLLALVRERRHG